MNPFFRFERERQIALRAAPGLFPVSGQTPVIRGGRSYDVLLPEPDENLEPGSRVAIRNYLKANSIVPHRMLGHLLSSQACCLNFLFVFTDRPDALACLLRPVFPNAVTITMAKVPEWRAAEGSLVQENYIAFEWTDWTDQLGEKGGRPPPRGANSTSTDAAMLAIVDGRRILCLIEWKYTESYGPRLSGGEPARRIREARYRDLAFAPDGPIRSDRGLWLTDFFHEPFYQMLRQQMLAWRVENSTHYDVDEVRVLHIGPQDNNALSKVTSTALQRHGDRAFDVFASVLVKPERFSKLFIEDLFASYPADDYEMGAWRD